MINTIIKQKQQFASQHVNNELVLVPLNNSIAQMTEMFTLNELGAFIWDQLTEESSQETIVDCIIDNYDIDRATAAKDVGDFLMQLSTYFQNYEK